MERPIVIDYWAGRNATPTEYAAEIEQLQTENALLRAELESFYYPRTALLKDLAELDKDEEGER